ncbi:MAG: hypothetical protein QM692_16835 [Thermomicrobiales bacterium]
MTPRALLTAIGATAFAFAVAIGIAADSASSQVAPAVASISAAPVTTAVEHDAANLLYTVANDDCPIAL